jgi:hypothetical protein
VCGCVGVMVVCVRVYGYFAVLSASVVVAVLVCVLWLPVTIERPETLNTQCR